MFNILLLTTEMRPGGAERIVHDLAVSLDQEKFRVTVAALDGRGEYADRIRAHGIEVIDLGAYHPWRVDVVLKIRKLLLEKNIHLLNTHLIHANVTGRLAAALLPKKIPVISTVHIVEKRRKGWHFRLDRLTSRWCDLEICVSEAAKKFHQEQTGLPDQFFTVIHNGIDLSRFEALPNSANRCSIRAEIGVPEDAFLIGGFGRFNFQKGFDLFLQAIAWLKNDGVDCRYALAGYGPEEFALKELARELGVSDQLVFAGYFPAAEEFIPALDLCVVPSRWEGMPLVLLETLACGVPVLASEIDSLQEVAVNTPGVFYVPAESPREIAKRIAEIAALPASETTAFIPSLKARAEFFSLNKMVAGYEAAFLKYL